jgi:hypothetical protein
LPKISDYPAAKNNKLEPQTERPIMANEPTPAQSREEQIPAKVRAGLTREQAIDVLDRQSVYDKSIGKKPAGEQGAA